LRRPDADEAVLILDDITAEEQWQQQLVQSEKLAALGQLSAGIAHELCNPLSALSTAAYCLTQALRQDGVCPTTPNATSPSSNGMWSGRNASSRAF
jgi:C4-dicarboxylate-specific signal transduction histidine kinase